MRRRDCELAMKKCAECEANHLNGAINSRQLLSIDFAAFGFFRMKHLALILSIPLLLVTAAKAAPVIIIVRHAEKASTGGNDPDLCLQGQKRADALAHILKDSQITSVFVTEFKRTQQTAAPTAKAAHVTPTVVPANDIGALVDKLRASNGNTLVVGHGNTIPDLLNALGIATPVSIPDDDYTEVFAVLVGDPPQLLRLHYPF
jgi:2,3-bisphosphoglycerate-dependent phosphoglycerate mutase